jgi:hypothetical protein
MPSLAEDLVLLLFDDESGRPVVDWLSLDNAVAGVVLLELANSGRVSPAEDDEAKPGRLVVRDDSATGDPVLDTALSRLDAKPVKAQRAVEVLVKGTREAVLDQLAGRGLLRREESKVLGLFPRSTWPALDSAHENEVRSRLDAVLVRGEEPDAHIGGLVALLDAINAVHKVVDGDKKALRARAKEVAEGAWAGDAVKKAVQTVQTAIIAGMTAATTASTAAVS